MPFLLFVVVLLAGAPALASPEKPEKAATVFVSAAKSADLFDSLNYPARVIPRINATVLSDADGVVSRIYAPLGKRVTRGQKLLLITHTDPIYQYAPMALTSPVTGVVSQVEVTEGSRVARGQKVASVTDPTKLLVTIEVPAGDLSHLRPGAEGQLRLRGADKTRAVRVLGVSPFVDPATGTATAELALAEPKPAEALPPGLFGQVEFKVNSRRGFSLPEHALRYKGKDPFIRLVQDGKVKEVAVRLGKTQRGQIEILEGLSEGAQVIERASRFVADGEAVTVQAPEGAK
jgi:multidrug efflux pump subunit AcrA (membrane-fusion protein)